MITVTHTDASFDAKASAFIVAVTSSEVKTKMRKDAQDFLIDAWGDHDAVFKAHNFTGAAGSTVLQVGYIDEKAVSVVCVGLGDLDKSETENLETLRRALGSGYAVLKKTQAKRVAVSYPSIKKSFGLSAEDLAEQVSTLFHIASYTFLENKGDKARKKKDARWEPTIVLTSLGKKDAVGIDRGAIIGKAMNETRTLADTAPNHLTPIMLAERMKKMAKEHGLKYTCFDQEKALKLGMGSYYSVAKGSENPGQFVTMEYKGKKGAPTIAFVGKGVCFDTGGISLKPSQFMGGMKYDMSGAAAVYGAMQAIAQLKPDVNVVGITPLVENMPSGRASKRDDVVTAMNGLTIEIENTDAEGRLILADALCYAEKNFKLDAIIDIATLTGSCMYALGHFYAGMFTRNGRLADTLTAIGFAQGDKVWRLPIVDEHKPALQSYGGDITNCGTPTYKADASVAALFLEHFVENKKWVHLDIAGTDSKIPDTTYLGRGATGTGVRILTAFACEYKSK